MRIILVRHAQSTNNEIYREDTLLKLVLDSSVESCAASNTSIPTKTSKRDEDDTSTVCCEDANHAEVSDKPETTREEKGERRRKHRSASSPAAMQERDAKMRSDSKTIENTNATRKKKSLLILDQCQNSIEADPNLTPIGELQAKALGDQFVELYMKPLFPMELMKQKLIEMKSLQQPSSAPHDVTENNPNDGSDSLYVGDDGETILHPEEDLSLHPIAETLPRGRCLSWEALRPQHVYPIIRTKKAGTSCESLQQTATPILETVEENIHRGCEESCDNQIIDSALSVINNSINEELLKQPLGDNDRDVGQSSVSRRNPKKRSIRFNLPQSDGKGNRPRSTDSNEGDYDAVTNRVVDRDNKSSIVESMPGSDYYILVPTPRFSRRRRWRARVIKLRKVLDEANSLNLSLHSIDSKAVKQLSSSKKPRTSSFETPVVSTSCLKRPAPRIMNNGTSNSHNSLAVPSPSCSSLADLSLKNQPPQWIPNLVATGRVQLLVSPMKRAIDTALHIKRALNIPKTFCSIDVNLFESGGPVYYDSKLRPIASSGRTAEELYQAYSNHLCVPEEAKDGWFKGGVPESSRQARWRAERVACRLESLARQRTVEAVVIVSHSGFLCYLAQALLNTSCDRSQNNRLLHSNTGVTALSVTYEQAAFWKFMQNRCCRIFWSNRTEHLSSLVGARGL